MKPVLLKGDLHMCTRALTDMGASSNDSGNQSSGEDVTMKLDDVHFTTKKDIQAAFQGMCRGDRESIGFLGAIARSHDQDALQNILDFLPAQARYQGSTLLWFLPVSRRFKTLRTNGINAAAMNSIRTLPKEEQPLSLRKALETLWIAFCYGVVQYHS